MPRVAGLEAGVGAAGQPGAAGIVVDAVEIEEMARGGGAGGGVLLTAGEGVEVEEPRGVGAVFDLDQTCGTFHLVADLLPAVHPVAVGGDALADG